MPSPIIFQPTPHDLDTDNADAEDAFGQVATVTDANFNAVRSYFNGRYPAAATANAWGNVGPLVSRVWTDFPPAAWGPVDVVIPKRPSFLLCMIGCMIHNIGRPNDEWLAASFRLSGTGLNNWVPPAVFAPYRVLVDNGGIAASVLWPVPAANLVAGGTVTLTPQYYLNSTNTSTDNTRIEYGQAALVCFV